ncbi:unnamed protein product [Linum trigynum]|uniref:Uncharacterized protein n=1 Tax=Linum trigynum TaxID=586398 RepID=A0AAV2CW58_9ROSI
MIVSKNQRNCLCLNVSDSNPAKCSQREQRGFIQTFRRAIGLLAQDRSGTRPKLAETGFQPVLPTSHTHKKGITWAFLLPPFLQQQKQQQHAGEIESVAGSVGLHLPFFFFSAAAGGGTLFFLLLREFRAESGRRS